MPTATRKKVSSARPATDSIEHLEEQNEIQARLLKESELEPAWRAKVKEFSADIFEAQEMMPDQLRGECIAYLYRLEPELFNTGKGSNIWKGQLPVTLEQIRKRHGGGKYKLWVKRGPRDMLQEIFGIGDCAPIADTGQVTRSGASAAIEKPSETAEVIRAIKELVPQGGNQKATEAAVDIMKVGYTNAVEMQNAANKSPTGNKFSDDLLPKLIERALAPPAAVAPVDPFTMIEKVVGLVHKLNPPAEPTEPTNADPIAQMGFVKDILGVDSFKDLLHLGKGRTAETPWYAQPLVSLGQNIPAILQWITQTSEMNFRRQLYLRSLPSGATPEKERLPVGAIPPGGPPPPPSFTQPATQEEMVQGLVQAVARYFQAGWDGIVCAGYVLMEMRPTVEMLAPVLTDEANLSQTIQQIPMLAALAQNPEWPQFASEFVQEIQKALSPPDKDEDDEGDEKLPVAGPAADAANGAAPPKPPGRKKKVAAAAPLPN